MTHPVHPAEELDVSQYTEVSFERLLDELIYVTAEAECAGKPSDFLRRKQLIRLELLNRYENHIP